MVFGLGIAIAASTAIMRCDWSDRESDVAHDALSRQKASPGLNCSHLGIAKDQVEQVVS